MSTQQQINSHHNEDEKPQGQQTQITKSQQKKKNQQKQNHADTKSQISEEEIPEHFYDSDIASVCEKDFMSNNEPPKDIVQQRKLLYKQKLLHVFKTIIRVGTGIDKPARYDLIKLKHKQVSQQEIKKYGKLKHQNHKEENEKEQNKDEKKQQNAQDKMQKQTQTQNSKKSNIKIKSKTQIHVIHAFDWATVIDLDGDKKLLKYVLKKGEGAFRVALYDRISFNYSITRNNVKVQDKIFENERLEKEFIEQSLANADWRVLTSMKDQQSVRLQILDSICLYQIDYFSLFNSMMKLVR